MADPIAGNHGFDGSCAPGGRQPYSKATWETFSLGIFQWLPKSGGKGTPRSRDARRERTSRLESNS